jgi:hypothetical protein
MTTSSGNGTKAEFRAAGLFGIISQAGLIVPSLIVGTILSASGFGRFLQVLGVFGIINSLGHFTERSIGNSGTYAGACPYCSALNKVWVLSSSQPTGSECPKCKNKFLLRKGRFYQIDFTNPRLDSRFGGIRAGIGLVKAGSIIAAIITFVVCLSLLAVLTSSELAPRFAELVVVVPFLLFSVAVSLALQVSGVWLCLRTPDRISAKRWILATVGLQATALALLSLQFVLRGAAWLNLPIEVTIFASQFTFLTYLNMLGDFLRRPDLVEELRSLRIISVEIFIGASAIGLGLPLVRDYEPQILISLLLLGYSALLGYVGTLHQLGSHLRKALAAQT